MASVAQSVIVLKAAWPRDHVIRFGCKERSVCVERIASCYHTMSGESSSTGLGGWKGRDIDEDHGNAGKSCCFN